ncbi:hypothetical protein LAZ67_12001824 [Cordylochernes scorpioides]|uniref:Uncharacterized protein n=1 Tax=Cordylochernes scorpioides TaxID=51811 RepID=A0ABY6L1D2_9ARAC|nr:hypothetical protein LAZ67_12001824 [Cordylochernes scorpioides]
MVLAEMCGLSSRLEARLKLFQKGVQLAFLVYRSVDPEHESGYRPLNFLYPQGLGKLEYSLAAQAVRRSRRLQGLEPQENIAMIKQETQTKMGEYHFQPFRNPSIFTGERNQNPEKWLKEFHRVARYNCWDDSMCLANVFFFSSKEQRTDGTKMLKRKLIHGIFL